MSNINASFGWTLLANNDVLKQCLSINHEQLRRDRLRADDTLSSSTSSSKETRPNNVNSDLSSLMKKTKALKFSDSRNDVDSVDTVSLSQQLDYAKGISSFESLREKEFFSSAEKVVETGERVHSLRWHFEAINTNTSTAAPNTQKPLETKTINWNSSKIIYNEKKHIIRKTTSRSTLSNTRHHTPSTTIQTLSSPTTQHEWSNTNGQWKKVSRFIASKSASSTPATEKIISSGGAPARKSYLHAITTSRDASTNVNFLNPLSSDESLIKPLSI